jgi:type IV secretory pathway ATPase VirB11/archaellum biosynthesis ATPase
MDSPTQLDTEVFLQVIHPGGLVISRLKFDDLKTLFNRALNTWVDAPPELLEFSDQIEKL